MQDFIQKEIEMELEKVIETYGIDREDLEGNDWYIVEKAEHIQHEVIGDLCIKTKDFVYKGKYENCYEYEFWVGFNRYNHYFKPINQKDYILIHAEEANSLEVKVRIKLEEGYEPLGGAVNIEASGSFGGTYSLLSQAMYRKGD